VTIDFACLGYLLFFAILGAFTGAVKQTVHLAGFALGYLAARTLGPSLVPLVPRGLPPVAAYSVANAAVFFLVFAVVHIAGRAILRRTPLGRVVHGAPDRGLGVLLGAGKAGLILWVILSALVFLDGPSKGFAWKFDDQGSDFCKLAREHNLFATAQFPQIRALRSILRAMQDPAAATKLQGDPDVQALLKDPRAQALLNDAGAKRAAAKGDDFALLRSVDAFAIITDPNFRGKLDILGARAPELPTMTDEEFLEHKKREGKGGKGPPRTP
jgi:membrane protein required for colicin V production